MLIHVWVKGTTGTTYQSLHVEATDSIYSMKQTLSENHGMGGPDNIARLFSLTSSEIKELRNDLLTAGASGIYEGQRFVLVLQSPLAAAGTRCPTPSCSYFAAFRGYCSSCFCQVLPQGPLTEAEERLPELRHAAIKAKFDDSLWAEPGITFSAHEFTSLCAMMSRLANTMTHETNASTRVDSIAVILLESKRLVTPQQAKEVYRRLAPVQALIMTEVVSVPHHVNWILRNESKLLTLVMGFLSDSDRWCSEPAEDRAVFWPVRNGCRNSMWGGDAASSTGRVATPGWGRGWSPTLHQGPARCPYAHMLRSQLSQLSSRLAAGSVLSQSLPSSMLPSLRQPGSRRLPPLPREICLRILNLAFELISPQSCEW